MLREIIDVVDLLDNPNASAVDIKKWLKGMDNSAVVGTKTVKGTAGETDFIKVVIEGKRSNMPILGIIGRLGGVGARPAKIGLVSDADGAIVALACAAKLLRMRRRGDFLEGGVIITTHICPDAPTEPHEPVPFMGSPVDMAIMNMYEVCPEMQAILSVDATKGNWIMNRRGFAITPTVKEGYILRVSDDLLEIMRSVTGEPPAVLAITTQDITPYGNGIHHLNSIMQPATATKAPVVGVAITATVPVPGCATGANQIGDLEQAARFCLEVAKAFTEGKCTFYDAEEFAKLLALYGPMSHLQTLGRRTLTCDQEH